jgi:hypothetical protein
MTDHATFHYSLNGSILAPAGSKLTDTGTGIVLPDGNILKIWEQLELQTPGDDGTDPYDISYDQAVDMGIHYDGDMCRFEEA